MPDDRLTERLRAYEARIPDADAPDLSGRRARGSAGWSVLLAGAAAATAAIAVAVVVILNALPPDVSDLGPSPSPSASASPPSQSEQPSPSSAGSPPTATALGWEFVALPDMELRDVAHLDGRLVAVGVDPAAGTAAIAISETGTDWHRVELDPALNVAAINEVVAGDDGFVALGFSYGTTAERDPTLIPIVLFSADATAWQGVLSPGLCGAGIVTGRFGYSYTASPCSSEPSPARAPITVFQSIDGRTWTSTTDHPEFADPFLTPWGLTTDGDRIVATQYGYGLSQGAATIWISDTGGADWLALQPFPPEVTSVSIVYGHGRYVATASFLHSGASSTPGVCLSADAEQWECTETPQSLPQLVATATGYAGLLEQRRDVFTTYPNQVAVVTSASGLDWDIEVARELENIVFNGIEATSVGVLAWGGTNPSRPNDESEPRVVLHRAPLP